MTLPFTFYWADETETTFNPSTMNVFDENIFSFNIKHDEGQIPTLDIVIKNPRIGLLNPGRKVWAWLGWQNGATLQPLFFGMLLGVPSDLFKEKVTLKFIARSPQYIANKQALAETMKVQPYYDPIWLEAAERDKPDSILEGWSSLWHVDRLTNAITASDILVGEDGTVTFTGDDAFYDSVSLILGEAPLANIRIEGKVNWTQRSSGFFTVPPVTVASYTGETFMSDWPKPGAGIGGGYKCEASFVTDTYLVSETPMTSYNYSWTSSDPNPGQCSEASATTSSSGPALLSPNPLSVVLTGEFTTGVCFPDSDPPQNIPSKVTVTGMIIPLWNLTCNMEVRYDSSRSYSEVITFDMTANTQGILASPTVSQDTELLSLSSVDVGQPLIEIDAWTDFASTPVGIGTFIFPNNPTTPGGLSFQVSVVAGTAGATEPVFSDVPGTITTDNTVQWASLGESPLTTAPGWSPASFVPVGQFINLQDTVFNPATGTWESVPGASSYYLCIVAGQTNAVYTTFQYTPPVVSNVEPTPAERTISNINPPPFYTAPGVTVADGGVTWLVLGESPPEFVIPIGGTPDTVTACSYFPANPQSVEYLIMRGRARLRIRARAVKIGWISPFGMVAGLSCRMNATLYDPRFPGGAATGKVVSYGLSCSGEGKLRGTVEIGCAIGFGDSVAAITGTPEYVSAGYVQLGYQVYDGATVVPGSNDTSYSLPVFGGFDDGLIFPLQWDDVSDGGVFTGSAGAQVAPITAAMGVARILAYAQMWAGNTIGTGNTNSSQTGLTPAMAWQLEQEQLALASSNVPYVMQANPVSWTALLKPCAGNGPFNGSYAITVSPLVVPQGIDLLAPSSP